MASLCARGLSGIPEVRAGDDLAELIVTALADRPLSSGQVVAIAHTAVSKAEGAVVVVGLGLNVNWTSGAPEGAVALNQLAGRDVDRAALLDKLLLSLDVRHGAPDLMDAYRARCSTICRRLRVELAGGDLAGTAVEIDDDGALVVEVDGERRRVLAGDVVHVRPA